MDSVLSKFTLFVKSIGLKIKLQNIECSFRVYPKSTLLGVGINEVFLWKGCRIRMSLSSESPK